MDFESRFNFETDLPPPRQISSIKRRKSFSEKFFKKTGTSLKLSGINTLRIRQKFVSKEKTPVIEAFGTSLDTANELQNYRLQQLLSLTPSYPPTPIPTVNDRSSKSIELVDPTNATVETSANCTPESSAVETNDCAPIVLSSTTDSYLPMSSNASVITLHRKGDKPKSEVLKLNGDQFGTFKHDNFVLNFSSEASQFSSINKNNINKSVSNNRTKFNGSSIEDDNPFDRAFASQSASIEQNSSRLAIPAPTTDSFDSNKCSLAPSTPTRTASLSKNKTSFYGDNSLSVARTNFTCRVTPTYRETPTPRDTPSSNKNRNSCSYESPTIDVIEPKNKLNRHSICDISSFSDTFCDNSNISSISNSGVNNFQKELMLRCSNNVNNNSHSQPIESRRAAIKPIIPVKPNRLKSLDRCSRGRGPSLKANNLEKEINNNTIIYDTDIPDSITPKEDIRVESSRPKVPQKPVPICRKPVENMKKIPLDTVLKKQLKNALNSSKCADFTNEGEPLSLSQSLKVRELVATFNNVLQLPIEVGDHLESSQKLSAKYPSDWNLCKTGSLEHKNPLQDYRCESISEFLNKRSIIEEKLPHMLSLIANGPPIFRTQI